MTSTMQRLSAGLAVALLTLSGLAACNDDPPPDAPTRSVDPTPSEPTEPTTDTTDAGPVEPELPEAAKKGNKRGAIAALEHYYALVDYAQEGGELTALARFGSRECAACRGGIKWLKGIHENGGTILGGLHSVTKPFARELEAGLNGIRIWQVDADVAFTSQRVRERAGGRVESTAAGTYTNTYTMRFRGEKWQVLDWRSVESAQ